MLSTTRIHASRITLVSFALTLTIVNGAAAQTQITPTLNGSNNNPSYPDQGAANVLYRRIANPNYADGIGTPIEAPNARYISNRIFADRAQNLFSQNGVTQWAYNWGQFIDHTIGLRAAGDEALNTVINAQDPLELFTNEGAFLRATRSAVADTGSGTIREQINTVSSYLDAWAVYGGSDARLEWLREGPVDDDMSNNSARLLLNAEGYLPAATARGEAASAPTMERQGQLLVASDADEQQIVAGDVRANENIALTSVQTLFAREHNRIVDRLPDDWTEQRRFDVARQLVIATQQYITFEEFLPALGVRLKRARGYQPEVDATLSNEFATVGFRAHSMIHGEIEMEVDADRYDDVLMEYFRQNGIELESAGGMLELAVPLNVAFGNPQLVNKIGLAPILLGLGGEPQYKNDEQIDNQLRSVLFQLPNSEIEDPDSCLDGPTMNECFTLINDLGVLDIVRGRDHGMPYYNDLRASYGLNRVNTFTEITGETSEDFPTDDPLVDTVSPIDDPDILDFIALQNVEGEAITLDSEEAETDAVTGQRRTTLAARLKAIYGDVNNVEAFVGMVAEPHPPGSELGELQLAMWQHEFESLRDGDANHYRWNQTLESLKPTLNDAGLTWRQSLSEVIVNNTKLEPGDVRSNLFLESESNATDSTLDTNGRNHRHHRLEQRPHRTH